MEFPPELNKSEVIDETPSPFDIRLNNTYIALYTTNEPIDIAVATRFLDEMDDIIVRSKWVQDQKRKGGKVEEYDGISVLRYRPENHSYHKKQADAYLKHLDQDETLNSAQKKLSLGYSILKHRFSNYEHRTALWEKLSSLNPDKPTIDIIEGAYDILDYRGSSLELRYNDRKTEDRIQFTFFFAIRLGTEPISNIDDFLNYHLSRNLGGDVKKFIRFLELTCAEYKKQAISSSRCRLVKKWCQSIADIIQKDEAQVSFQDRGLPTNSGKKLGRKPQDKSEIPMPPEPIHKLNDITVEAVAYLFYHLRNQRIIYDQETVSHANAAKAIRGLTGLSENRLRRFIGDHQFSAKAKRNILKVLQDITLLIDKDLSL